MKIFTAKARQDYPNDNIKKGELYYYCTPRSYRKQKDRRKKDKSKVMLEEWIQNYAKSHRGEFGSNMEDWQIRFTELEDEDQRDELAQEIEDFLDQKRDSLDNLPYQLQESHILNEQIEELETLLDEVNSWDGWGE